ncbi:Uncharacterized membrane-anchored protein YitT, contains DUF161 and DUF2179 domains [Peptoclostridium litorale DSM 5388]|uniref:Membrane family protein n=1 Tax=Peptoclostridium litorale DSM 5388 TaxID=1121324 RepID=A0A069RFQ2_PEPLI|nr:YitT family protein [Peptoclostridium litorale]KDR95874.1 membrane family protein [Peptoclostridium litorale DSM 5388]SIO10912.1 Uncharacterized membrane-anchored protein YitT, contains DUF161 and DUF2179 domains [Peptoclostridium litorale DSM 5388]
MKDNIKELGLLVLSAFLLAAGVYYFLAPNEIAAGGTTGIAIIITNYFPNANIGILMMIMDVILYSVGFLLIGPVFGIKTMFCSFTTSFFVFIMQKYFPISTPISSDILVQLIFGICMCGIGMAIAFDREASTGGLDIAVKIINKFFKVKMAHAVFMVDTFIILGAVTAFGIEKGLYALLGVFMLCVTINIIMEKLRLYQQVILSSSKVEAARDYIANVLGGKVSIYYAKDGCSDCENAIIMAVLKSRDFLELKNYMSSIDPDSFITAHNINEVCGNAYLGAGNMGERKTA